MGSNAPRRYTSGMKLAPLLSRHRRLLALCGLSAAVHLLVLELAARRDALPPAAPPVGDVLRLRLVQARPAAAAMPARDDDDGARAAAAVPTTPESGAERSAAANPAVTNPVATTDAPPESAGAAPVQMPGRYRVRMPDRVQLSYALARQAPGAAPVPAGSASIAWRSDGARYTLTVDGVLGRLSSEGVSGDAGIAPRRSGEERPGAAQGGAMQVKDFVEDAVGAQDRASVLMQLAGIGLGEPDQIVGQVGNDLEIVVAGADGATIARYTVMGQEQVATAIGELAAWRLAQVVPAGQDRLELWLAPGRGWLPVQLRLTHPDGSASTQTLTRIEPGAPQ
jgi:hypothetical protein